MQVLANISTGQGTQLSNISQNQGNNAANSALQSGANQQQLIGNLAGAYGLYKGGQNPAAASAFPGLGGFSTQQFINSQNAGNSGFTGFGG